MPVMVMVTDPGRAPVAAETFIVDVPEPGAAMDKGLKLTVTPDGAPVALNATAESNPPEMALVIVVAAELPHSTVSEEGDALRAKAAPAGEFTVRAIIAVSVVPFPTPLIVIVYVPVVAVEAAFKVRTELPEPGAGIGLVLNSAVTPAGNPLADKVTA